MLIKKIKILMFMVFVALTTISAQDELLQSGPMVGYSTMREVMLWVQTKAKAEVKIVYWDVNNPSKKFETDPVETNKHEAFTAHLIADEVEPGNVYNYSLVINGKNVKRPYQLKFETQTHWQWRTDPPAFSFATGSGAYINEKQYDRAGKPYGGDYEIYLSIHDKHPDMMLWLGDNSYLREADYNSRTGILKRFTHDRATKEMQPLFGSASNYAIWDDHDFGPDNSDRSFWGKDITLEAFKLFWANPSYGINGKPGTTTKIQWADVDFFLMDNRYYRSPDNRKFNKRVMFGDDQVQWLVDALKFSKAPFKFIATGGQVLTPIADFETYSTYPEEKAKLLNLIEEEGITGVIFLTGDRHFTEISKMKRRGTYPLYDFTISPFTSGANTHKPEPNFYRVPGTHVTVRNFAIFEISGTRKNRVLKCTDYDKDGKVLWEYSIKANDLR